MRHSPDRLRALRVAAEDVELGGFIIPAGHLVIANTASANRDPAVYADPTASTSPARRRPPC